MGKLWLLNQWNLFKTSRYSSQHYLTSCFHTFSKLQHSSKLATVHFATCEAENNGNIYFNLTYKAREIQNEMSSVSFSTVSQLFSEELELFFFNSCQIHTRNWETWIRCDFHFHFSKWQLINFVLQLLTNVEKNKQGSTCHLRVVFHRKKLSY